MMGQTDEEESLALIMYDAALTWKKFYIPFLFIFGIIGNSLSILVFSSTVKYRRQSASYYLSALAVSDSVFLLVSLLYVLDGLYYGMVISGQIICKLVTYLSYVTRFLSAYLTVVFSIERFLVTHFPLARQRICTCSRARKIIAGMTVIALFLFSHLLIIFKTHVVIDDMNNQLFQNSSLANNETFENFEGLPIYNGTWLGPYICAAPDEYLIFFDVFRLVDTVITFIIPFFLIAYFNLRIVISLRGQSWLRKNIHVESCSSGTSTLNRTTASFCEGKQSESKPESDEHDKHENIPLDTILTSSAGFESRCDGYLGMHQDDKEQPEVKVVNLHENGLEHSIPNKAAICGGTGTPEKSNSIRNEFDVFELKEDPSGESAKNNGFPQRQSLLGKRSSESTASEARVTRILLIVSAVFLILNLPGHLVRFADAIRYIQGEEETSLVLKALYEWTLCLVTTNFAVNFLLYCISGSHFRNSLRNMLGQNRFKRSRP